MPTRVSIKELHATTGELVRRAGSRHSLLIITDRGQPVAALVHPSLATSPRRKRKLLPEFETMMRKNPKGSVLADLDAVRGDR